MRLGLGHGLNVRRRFGGGAAPAAILSSINAEGSSSEYIGTPPTFDPDVDPVIVPGTRAGFSTTGTATTYSDSIVLVSRMRIPLYEGAPPLEDLPLEPNKVANSSLVYIDDDFPTRDGNNSTVRSPKLIACHAIGHRDLFQQTLVHEVVLGHRNAREGRQFACAIITITDSLGATQTQTVATQIVSNRTGDQCALEVARFSVDTGDPGAGGLANGPVSYNVRGYPWYGVDTGTYATSSYIDSGLEANNDQSVAPFGIKGFTTRWAEKRFGGWPIAYVNNLGSSSESTAGWTLDGSTEGNSALHFTTLRVATNAFYNAANTTVTGGGALVGEIRLVPHSTGGTYGLGGPSASPARSGGTGALIITKSPAAADYEPKLAFGSSGVAMAMSNPTTGRTAAAGLILRNLTLVRSGASAINTTTGNRLEVWFDNVIYDIGNDGNGGTPVANQGTPLQSGVTSGMITGMRVINSSYSGSPTDRFNLVTVTSALHAWTLVRGLDFDNAPAHRTATSATSGIDGNCMLASKVNGLYNLLFGSYNISDVSGTVMKANLFPNVQKGLTDAMVSYLDLVGSTSATAVGVLLSTMVFEVITSDGASFRVSADSQTASTDHVVLEGLFVPTGGSNRRANGFYTDGPTPRTHTRNAVRGCFFGQFNMKSDLDAGVGRTGNFSLLYGTDCFGTVTGFSDANGTGNVLNRGYFVFSQQYLGLGSSRGLQRTDQPDWGHADFEAITQLAAATQPGLGNGDYSLRVEGGMPTPDVSLYDRVAIDYRGVDITGVTVSSPDSTGPYA